MTEISQNQTKTTKYYQQIPIVILKLLGLSFQAQMYENHRLKNCIDRC